MNREKLAFIIPTKDRAEQLKNLLFSIKLQEYKPEQIIIVDGSKVPVLEKLRHIEGLRIEYIRVGVPSLTRQRNEGLKLIDPDITLVVFLDDDVTLEINAVAEMIKFWENASADVGGACFNIITDKPSQKNWLKHLFLMGNKKEGVVLRSGYNTKICPASEDLYSQWLLGGVTIWRRKVINEFKFDEWFQGYGLFEDLEYSYRVGKQFKLAVVSNAKVRHSYLGINRRDNFQFGKMEIINRHHIVKNNPDLSLVLFYWASLGQLLENLLRILLHRKKGYLLRAAGNLRGFLSLTRQGNAKV